LIDGIDGKSHEKNSNLFLNPFLSNRHGLQEQKQQEYEGESEQCKDQYWECTVLANLDEPESKKWSA